MTDDRKFWWGLLRAHQVRHLGVLLAEQNVYGFVVEFGLPDEGPDLGLDHLGVGEYRVVDSYGNASFSWILNTKDAEIRPMTLPKPNPRMSLIDPSGLKTFIGTGARGVNGLLFFYFDDAVSIASTDRILIQ